MMNIDKFTERAQEAILSAQKLGEKHNHTQLEPEHLLLALIQQADGVVLQILNKLGTDSTVLLAQLQTELDRQPRATQQAQLSLSPRLDQVLNQAEKEAEQLKDEYVSTEHLLIGIIEKDQGAAGRILKERGVTRDTVYG